MSAKIMPTDSSDIKSSERIELIDSLRGYALMGLFLVHMVEYYELYWYKTVESGYKDVVFAFFAGKSYAMFALLFGVSFYIIFSSLKKKQENFLRLISWRFTLLLIAGLIHSILYSGDILQVLALAGFILIPIHKLPDRLFIALAAIILFQVPWILYLAMNGGGPAGYDEPLHWSLYAAVYEIYAHGNLSDVIKVNLTDAPFAKWAFMLESGRVFTIPGMAMLGYWFGKTGYFLKSDNGVKKYWRNFIVSGIIAVAMYYARTFLAAAFNADTHWMRNAILNNYIDLVFTFFSVFAFSLLYQLSPLRRLLGCLAPPGRMSLTLYIFQSIIFIPVFYGFGMGTYAYLGQGGSVAVGIVFWVVQMFFAYYWLKNYHYGPLEYLWRSATFMRRDIRLRKVGGTNENTSG